MKKSLLFLLLTAATAFSVSALTTVNVNGINYGLDETAKTATVQSSSSYSGDIDLSQGVTYDGVHYDITAIAANAFFGDKNIGTLKLPSTLTSIGMGAFNGSSLSGELVIPESLTVMGKSAFSGCNITSLDILSGPWKKSATDRYPWGNSAGTSAAQTFMNCTSLRSVTFPDGKNWTTIPTQIFDGCTSLSSMKLPNDAAIIAQSAFRNTALTSVTIPASVTQIDFQTFYNAPVETLTILGEDNSLNISTDAFSHDSEHTPTLKNVYISRKNPPTFSSTADSLADIFGGNADTMTVILQGAAEKNRDAYESASLWKDLKTGQLTGINGVEGDNAPVEIYTLQGIRVNNQDAPEHGIYIVKQGSRVTKILK